MGKITLNKLEKKISGRKPKPIGKHSFYSVLVPVVKKDNKIWILYEIRSDMMKHQPGEVCFPGGALEKGETKVEGAIRETCEELGIEEKGVRIIGQLDTLYGYSNFTMYAYLGVIDYKELLKGTPNEAEVKDYFLVPLENLIDNPPFVYKTEIVPKIGDDFPYSKVNFDNGYNWRKGVAEIPIYLYEDKVIWGMTARITKNLIEILTDE